MSDKIKPVPEGYRTVTPSLAFKDCAKALAFYEKAFGAKVSLCMTLPDGKVPHAEVRIGDSFVFCSDEWPNHPVKAPASVSGGVTGSLYLYVEDCDAWHKRAVAAGAKSTMSPENMFWGDRMGSVADPFGHHWTLATHVENVSPAEMEKRQKAWIASMAAGAAK